MSMIERARLFFREPYIERTKKEEKILHSLTSVHSFPKLSGENQQ